MFDYIEKISDFISANFSAADAESSNFKKTTKEFLSFLFNTFPDGCISEYELNDLLIKLGYKPSVWNQESITEYSNKKEITYQLITGWCFNAKILKPTEVILLQNQSE